MENAFVATWRMCSWQRGECVRGDMDNVFVVTRIMCSW